MPEPTMMDLITAVQGINQSVDGLDKKIDGLDERVERLDKKIDDKIEGLSRRMCGFEGKIGAFDKKFEARFDDITETINDFATDTERRLTYLEQNMVTKEYLEEYMDEKLEDFHQDIRLLVRMEDHKLGAVINLLEKHDSISPVEAQQIRAMEPFPKLA